MASLAQQFTGLKCLPISPSSISKRFTHKQTQRTHIKKPSFGVVAYKVTPELVPLSNETRERQKLKEIFEEVYERCRTAPMEGVSFTLEDFSAALEKYDFNSEIGTKVLSLLVKIYQELATPDYLNICQCLMILDEPESVANILEKYIHSENKDDALLAFQITFDLVENEHQAFLLDVRDCLSPSKSQPSD